MSELAIFNFQNKKVRVVEYQGQPWFVLRDLLEAMDSKTKVTDAVESINQGLGKGFVVDYPLLTAGGEQQVIIIAEAAATYLVARSNTQLGRQLNRFIHIEVLPQIRQYGRYELTPQNPSQNIAHIDNQLLTLAKQQKDMKKQQEETHSQVLAIKREMQVQAHTIRQEIKDQFHAIQKELLSLKTSVREGVQDFPDAAMLRSKFIKQLFLVIGKLQEGQYLTEEQLKKIFAFIQNYLEAQETFKIASKKQSGYSTQEKADLQRAALILRDDFKFSPLEIAAKFNEDGAETLSGKGEWTAAKVKRLLAS